MSKNQSNKEPRMSDLDAMGRHVAEEIAKQKQPGGLLHDNPMRGVVGYLREVGFDLGVYLSDERSMRPDHIAIKLPPENRKAAALLVGVYRLLCHSLEGRQAICDLGLKPLFEQVECPGSRGLDD